MNTWTAFPFLRITGVFVLGLLISKYVNVKIDETSHYLLGALVLLFLITKFLKAPKNLSISGNIGLLIICLAGIMRFQYSRDINNPSHLFHCSEKVEAYQAMVSSTYQNKEKYYIYEVDVINVLVHDSLIDKSGKVQLYIRKNDLMHPPLRYGDKFILAKNPFLLRAPKNPHEFDYKQHMAGRNIYYQQFVDFKDVKIIDRGHGYFLFTYAYKLREYFANELEKNILGKREMAVAKALILGIKDGLDNDLKKSYSASGAMHVLAVSGLHVGIIIVIVAFLLRPLKHLSYGKYISLIITLGLLWLFAILTGLSPSILRAVTMFSIIIVGQTFRGSTNVYNSLAISALVLLFFDPNFLFSVGFQLSYIAVIGIIYIYPKIHNLWVFDNWFVEKVWSITCLSLAAQLATFPLTIYYFHQFPVYFLISNLVVIPAAFLIMSFGLALLVLSKTVIGAVIGKGLEYLILGLNSLVSFIEQTTFSLIDWLYLSHFQTVSIYLIIALVLCLIHYRKIRFLYYSLMVALIISADGVLSVINQYESKKIIFYQIDGESVFDRIDGFNSELISVNQINNPELIKFQVGPNRLKNLLEKVENKSRYKAPIPSNYDGLSYYQLEDKKFMFIEEPIKGLEFENKVNTDYLVICQNSTTDIDLLLANFNFSEIIVDGSNDYNTCKYYEAASEKTNLKCTVLRNDGALEVAI